MALFRSICTGRAITWTRWTAEAVSDGREPRGREWTAPSTWPASYPRYSIRGWPTVPTVRGEGRRRRRGIVEKFQISRIRERKDFHRTFPSRSVVDERIDRVSTLPSPRPLFLIDRDLESFKTKMEIFSMFGRYSGVCSMGGELHIEICNESAKESGVQNR